MGEAVVDRDTADGRVVAYREADRTGLRDPDLPVGPRPDDVPADHHTPAGGGAYPELDREGVVGQIALIEHGPVVDAVEPERGGEHPVEGSGSPVGGAVPARGGGVGHHGAGPVQVPQGDGGRVRCVGRAVVRAPVTVLIDTVARQLQRPRVDTGVAVVAVRTGSAALSVAVPVLVPVAGGRDRGDRGRLGHCGALQGARPRLGGGGLGADQRRGRDRPRTERPGVQEHTEQGAGGESHQHQHLGRAAPDHVPRTHVGRQPRFLQHHPQADDPRPDLGGVAGPRLRIGLKHLGQQLPGLPVDADPVLPAEAAVVLGHRRRLPAGQQGHGHRAQSVDVGGRAGVPLELLRGHVAEGARQGAAAGLRIADHVPDGAEVHQHQPPVVGAADDVAGLDVPVDHRGRQPVQVLEDAQHLVEEGQHLKLGGADPSRLVGQGLALDELGHHRQGSLATVPHHPMVPVADDARVIELAQHTRLPLVELADLGRQHVAQRRYLDRYRLAARQRRGPEHRAPRPLPDLLVQSVPAVQQALLAAGRAAPGRLLDRLVATGADHGSGIPPPRCPAIIPPGGRLACSAGVCCPG